MLYVMFCILHPPGITNLTVNPSDALTVDKEPML